jgi:hypothetical protein
VIKDKARLHTFLRETSINNFLTLLFCIHVFLLLFMQPDQIGVILTLLKLRTASVVLIGPTETFFVPGFSEGLQCFACCTRIVKQKATICLVENLLLAMERSHSINFSFTPNFD